MKKKKSNSWHQYFVPRFCSLTRCQLRRMCSSCPTLMSEAFSSMACLEESSAWDTEKSPSRALWARTLASCRSYSICHNIHHHREKWHNLPDFLSLFFGCSSAQLGKLRLKCYFISLLFFRHHTCIYIIQKDNILNLNKNKTKNRIRLYKAFITEPGNPRLCCKAVHTSPSHEINGWIITCFFFFFFSFLLRLAYGSASSALHCSAMTSSAFWLIQQQKETSASVLSV